MGGGGKQAIALLVLHTIAILGSAQTNYSPLFTPANFVKTIDLSRPVGTVAGEAGTTPSGASTYTIPIYAPPGTNGLSPSVSLTYSSQGGVGQAGYGWNISGLSVISRSGKNLHYNNEVAPVQYTSTNDAFLLDGIRLNPVSGDNGLDGTIYATEAESFSQIISYKTSPGLLIGPDWFLVTTKDGAKMEFGKTPDSKLMTDDGERTMIWRMSRLTDIYGNYIDFKYDNTGRDSRIDEIIYTGNLNAGLQPYNKIKFNYGNRYETNTLYDGGASVATTYLLNSIIIKHTNDQGIEEVVKTYTLKYGFDNVHSLLQEIEECGALPPPIIPEMEKGGLPSPPCLNSTIFLYGDTVANFIAQPSPGTTGDKSYYTGDFNADGKSDLLMVESYFDANLNMRFDTKYYMTTGSSGNNIHYTKNLPQGASLTLDDKKFYHFLTADYNKDGRDDVVELNVTWNQTHLKRQLNVVIINQTTNSGYNPVSYPIPAGYNIVHQGGNFFIPGDFDGDGNQDYILVLGKWISGTTFEYKAFLTRPAMGEVNTLIYGLGDNMGTYPASGAEAVGESAMINPIDVDGDGKMELLITTKPVSGTSSSYLFWIAKSGNSYLASFNNSYSPYTEINKDCKLFPGDFNGDRKSDILMRKADGSWKLLISNGFTFLSAAFTFNQQVVMNGNINHKIVVADFNADGKSDILHGISNGFGSSSELSVYYSKGNNMWHNEVYLYGNRIPSVQWTVLNGFATGDFNGDGRTDILNVIDIFTNSDIIYFKPNSKERLLSKVTNGHNVTTLFEYKCLTDKTSTPYVYTRTIQPDNPLNQSPFNYVELPVPVVSGYIVSDGIGGLNTTRFYYEDAVIHRYAKGFLGFKKVKSLNEITGAVSISESDINIQYAVPFVTRQKNYLLRQPPQQDELLSETAITTSFINRSTGSHDIRYFQRVDKSLQVNYLNGSAAESENTFDTYGNVLQSIVRKGVPSGATVSPVETETITTVYGQFGTPVPASPISITKLSARTGQPPVTVSNSLAYNPNGSVASKTDFAGLPLAVTTSLAYNPLGNIIQTTISASGVTSRVATAQYDARGRFPLLNQAIDGNVIQKETFTYDGKWGEKLTQTDINCLTSSFAYDAFGRLISTVQPEGYSVSNSLVWDIQGEQLFYSYTDFPGGKPDSKVWMDKLGREIKSQTAGFGNQWLTKTKSFNNKGQLLAETAPFYSNEQPFITSYIYDDYGRNSTVTTPVNTITTSYTKLSGGQFKVTVENAAGQVSSKTTDAAGRVILANDQGGQLAFTYDSRGNQVATTMGGIVLASSIFDVYCRQTSLTDKNAGTISYLYDAFGQIVQQTDANGNTYNMAYDGFGRNISRSGPEGVTIYEYYTGAGITRCKGHQLKKVTGFNGIIKEYTYDNLQRLQSETITADGQPYITTYTYDAFSNPLNTTYASGVVVNNIYDNNGGLLSVSGGDSWNPVTLFTANSVNGYGQYTSYTLGNGKTTQNTYTHGMPTRLFTPGVQDLQFSFDLTRGNLTNRYDALKNLSESFQYDNLDRLTQCSVNGVQQLAINYDGNSSFSLGNITAKTDAGNYVYQNNKIHAVAYITNPAGPQAPPVTPLPANDQQISYTAFMKTAAIAEGNVQTLFTYGPDYQRIKTHTLVNGNVTTTKYFLNGMERVSSGGYTRDIHFIPLGNSIAIIEKPLSGNSAIHYIYTDYLGSLLIKTDANGAITAEQNFDAWGRRRNPANWQYQPYTGADFYDRGYTGHEHLPLHVLINMNGRMYDPVQGRMLSPDNYVPDPWHTQGYNRYSYANNNPLKFTDPDGNFIHLIVGAIVGGLFNLMNADIKGNIGSFWDGIKYFGVGAVAGALGAGMGAGLSAYLAGGSFSAGFMGMTGATSAGFFAGSASGAIGGFSAGFISGFGNHLIEGGNLKSSIEKGFQGGLSDAIGGSIIGGITGGIQAIKSKTNFFTGNAKVNLSSGVGAHNISTETLDKTVSIKYVGRFERISVYESATLGYGSGSGGITLPGMGIIVGSGAYTQMGRNGTWNLLAHEFGHVLQSKLPLVGADGFYGIIGPESLASATFNSGAGHSHFWTETWANYLSNNYFKSSAWDMINFPIRNINWENKLKFYLWRMTHPIPIPAIYP